SFNWVNFLGAVASDYAISARNTTNTALTFLDETLDVLTDIIVPGRNITLDAGAVNIHGAILDTSSPTHAGNITITGTHITIDGGAQIKALGTSPGATAGTIAINAVDDHAKIGGAGFAQVSLNTVDVTIGNATIQGGDVTILATASNKQILKASDFG